MVPEAEAEARAVCEVGPWSELNLSMVALMSAMMEGPLSMVRSEEEDLVVGPTLAVGSVVYDEGGSESEEPVWLASLAGLALAL